MKREEFRTNTNVSLQIKAALHTHIFIKYTNTETLLLHHPNLFGSVWGRED